MFDLNFKISINNQLTVEMKRITTKRFQMSVSNQLIVEIIFFFLTEKDFISLPQSLKDNKGPQSNENEVNKGRGHV